MVGNWRQEDPKRGQLVTGDPYIRVTAGVSECRGTGASQTLEASHATPSILGRRVLHRTMEASLRFHFDSFIPIRSNFEFIAMPRQCHSDVTSVSLRSQIIITLTSLRFHIGVTSIARQYHFDANSIPLRSRFVLT